jgi:hypothetical protein
MSCLVVCSQKTRHLQLSSEHSPLCRTNFHIFAFLQFQNGRPNIHHIRHNARGTFTPHSCHTILLRPTYLTTQTQQWNDFYAAGACHDDQHGASPYILASSPSPSTLERTETITSNITTSFALNDIDALKSAHASIQAQKPNRIQPTMFVILEPADRHVVYVYKNSEWFREDGSKSNDATGTRWTVWEKYRCGYEESFRLQCALEGFGGWEMAEECFVEELGREHCEEESEEEVVEEEETDSEDEDWEYGDHPLEEGEGVKGA